MKKYLLPENGAFYKANLHCHTTISDGKCTPEEIKEIYKEMGYSIVAYTDHDILLPHTELNDDDFLALHGFEVEINEDKDEPFSNVKSTHLCFIALEEDNLVQPCWNRTWYLFGNAPKYAHLVKFDESEPDYWRSYNAECVTEMLKKGREKGFFATYNHPAWSLDGYESYINYDGMNAMEIFNGSCIVSGYEDYNNRVYDDILKSGKRIYCIGADDNHNLAQKGTRKFDSGIAWTEIKADRLSYRDITRALESGHFYASEGPEIYELYTEDGYVSITTSAADKIQLNCDIRMAQSMFDEGGEGITSAKFKIPENAKYFRLTVTDKCGKHACTNAYFTDEL